MYKVNFWSLGTARRRLLAFTRLSGQRQVRPGQARLCPDTTTRKPRAMDKMDKMMGIGKTPVGLEHLDGCPPPTLERKERSKVIRPAPVFMLQTLNIALSESQGRGHANLRATFVQHFTRHRKPSREQAHVPKI